MRGLGERVRAACNELGSASGEHNVVVVSHVSPIKAAVAWYGPPARPYLT